MYCRACWTNLPDGTVSCPKCGADASAPASQRRAAPGKTSSITPKRSSSPPPSSGRGFSLATVLLAIIFAAASAYYCLYSPKGDSPMPAVPAAALPAGSVNFDVAVTLERESPEAVFITDAYEVAADDGALARAASLIDDGDYEGASLLLREHAYDYPDDDRAGRYLVRTLMHIGVEAYNQGRFEAALGYFEEAVEHVDEPAVVNWLATTEFKLGRLEEAVQTLSPLAGDPNADRSRANIYSLLSERAYEEGRTGEAVRFLTLGVEADPSNASMSSRLKKLSTENKVEDGFRTKAGSHFVVRYAAGENAVAGHLIALLLEEAYINVGAELGFYPEDRIVAVLYSGEEFRDTTRSPKWTSAIFDGRIKLPVGGVTEKTELLEAVLFHEYTHAVVHRLSGGRSPVWLNEGIAQYEEGKRSASRADEVRRLLSSGNVSLKALEDSFMGLNAAGARSAYLLSLSAVEYMAGEFGVSSLRWLFEGLRDGKSLERAMSDAIYLSYEEFEESWKQSVLR